MSSKNIYLLIILVALSGITRFLFFGYPSAVIFDEIYFGKYASDYITGDYYFDPHPPLGKLLIYGTGQLGGVTSDPTNYSAIGNAYEGPVQFWYRLLPAVAGMFLPPIIFLLALVLGLPSIAAFAAGALVILENSLLVQSRFVSLDSILLLFGFISLLTYFHYRKTSSGSTRVVLLITSAVFSAAAIAIKWTGLAYPLIIVVVQCIETFDRDKWMRSLRSLASFVGIYVVISIFLYILIFIPHFSLLKNSGQGNDFMTARFQKTLAGNIYTDDATIESKGFFGKFIELNLEMYGVNKRMNATHPYSSEWYTWPFMSRTVFYWQGDNTEDGGAYIYFIGNPFIYWLGTFSMLLLAAGVMMRKLRERIPLIILIGFLANFIPYIFIGRVMFIYHYQAALVFSILALCWVINHVMKEQRKLATTAMLLGICLISFIFFSPLTYGTYIDSSELKARMWLKGWR